MGDIMSKEKQSEYTQKNKEFTFIYEVAGIICLLIALISIAKLGIVGKYGLLTFRLLFGDWYFIFLLLLGALGVYFLFVHHHFTIKNIRYLGIILVVLSIIIISHFSMHEFVSEYEGNSFKNTIFLYLEYFKNYRPNMMRGGGIIGCIFFYILYFLFSSVGTIIVCGFMFFMGIVFICKKTIFEFIRIIINTLRNGFGGAKNYSKKIKGCIKKFNDDYITERKKVKPYSRKILEEQINDLNKQNKQIIYYIEATRGALNHLGISFQNISYIVCNHISVIFIKSYHHINYEVLRLTLAKIYNEPFLIRYDNKNDLLVIEISNISPRYLSMKEALLNCKETNFSLILGKDDRNKYVDCVENLIIISNNVYSYYKYFLSLCLFPHFRKDIMDYELIMIDLYSNFNQVSSIFNKYETNKSYFSILKDNLDNLLNKLSDKNYTTIDEYNKKEDEFIKRPIIYINGLDKIMNDYEINKILEYLFITGTNVGYLFITSILDNNINNESIIRYFNYRIFLKNDLSITSRYFSSLMIDSIDDTREGFLKYQDILIRISLLMINDTEIKKLKIEKKDNN